MLGILFKVLTASFPFLKEMLFGRSANGRNKMISFLVICNIAMAISFFTTAKVTANLYISERKHKDEIRDLKHDLEGAAEAITKTKAFNGSIIEIVSTYNASIMELNKRVKELEENNKRLEIELAVYRSEKQQKH
jgi:hypothetical protein